MTKKVINIFSENIYPDWKPDEKDLIDTARKVLESYLLAPEIFDDSCLKQFDFDTISFDILYCDGAKTHEINKEYRSKDYPADIITFAIFADSDARFVFDGEINLGEMIIALDKIIDNAREKGVSPEYELDFLISHGIMHLLGFDHQTEEDYNFIVRCQEDTLKKIRDINV